MAVIGRKGFAGIRIRPGVKAVKAGRECKGRKGMDLALTATDGDKFPSFVQKYKYIFHTIYLFLPANFFWTFVVV